jgi:hypothetical protein
MRVNRHASTIGQPRESERLAGRGIQSELKRLMPGPGMERRREAMYGGRNDSLTFLKKGTARKCFQSGVR